MLGDLFLQALPPGRIVTEYEGDLQGLILQALQVHALHLLEGFHLEVGRLIGLHVGCQAVEGQRPVDALEVSDGALVLVHFESLQDTLG